jgi:hypothetical protein
MSFIRPGELDSDVYVYPVEYSNGVEGFMCCEVLSTKDDMVDHLLAHRHYGDCVPDEAFDRLAEWDRIALEWAVLNR